jgi:DNA mismatch endonuclease (patch repair protein)
MKRNDFPTTPERSKTMRAVKSKDTGPELALRSACHRLGLRHRKHRRDLPGTPDFMYPSARVAVFVDGDFWHGRKWLAGGRPPRTNTGAWVAKFARNALRDAKADAELLCMGWLPLRVWGSDVGRRPAACARLVRMAVRLRQQVPDVHGD